MEALGMSTFVNYDKIFICRWTSSFRYLPSLCFKGPAILHVESFAGVHVMISVRNVSNWYEFIIFFLLHFWSHFIVLTNH